MKKYAIIVAGGKGTRMNADIPKQFLKIGGTPILMKTLQTFHQADPDIELIVVLPQTDHEYWQKLIADISFTVPHQLIAGGSTRFDSVKNGLNAIEDNESLVAIHDGVRPFITESIILNSFIIAEKRGSAVATVPVKNSLRMVGSGINKSVFRSNYVTVQTPQTFMTSRLKHCFNQDYRENFTDDATVYESLGNVVHLIDGDEQNIKITTPQDLLLAEAIVNSKK